MPAGIEVLRMLIPSSQGDARSAAAAERISAFLERHVSHSARVEVEVAASYAELERRMLAGEAPVAWAPPIVAARLELHGGRPLLRFERRGKTTYASALVATGDVSLDSPGLRVAWVERDSTAGYLLPRAFLQASGPRVAFAEERFVGSYEAALDELLAGRVDLAAVHATRAAGGGVNMAPLEARTAAERARCRVVAVTAEVPNDGLVLGPGASAELAEALSRDLLAVAGTPEGRQLLSSAFHADGFERAEPGSYQALYSLVLKSFGFVRPSATCAACGWSLSAQARFCERCGTAAAKGGATTVPATERRRRDEGRPDWEEERKLATVLFADIAGFTRLSSQLEPEAVRDFANACLEPLAAEVQRCGGTVVKYLGDAIMAVFGVPRGDEADARRAVRAGLGMCRALEELSEEMESRYGAPIGVRVGINTGLVMVGAVGASKDIPDVMGGTVNLASRIEGAAKAGEVLIGQATYRMCEGAFDFEPLGGMDFKGVPAPTAVYRVLGVRSEPAEGSGVRTFDGTTAIRHRELRTLRAAFHEACVTSCIKAVKVIGDAGLGQTWLLGALRSSLAHDPRGPVVLRAAGTLAPAGSQTPLGLLGQLLRAHFHVDLSEEPAVARAHLEEGIRRAFSSPDDADAREVAALLTDIAAQGHDGESSSRLVSTRAVIREDRVLGAFVRWVFALAQRAPVCLLFRELQWADAASLEVIERLFWSTGRLPILLVLGARPELDDKWMARAASSGRFEHIELEPLSPDSMRRLIEHLLAPLPAAPPSLKDAILKRAEGSPDCAKELVRLLVDQGAIVVGDEGQPWRWVPERFGNMQLPATVHGVLQARLDRLPDDERTTLKRASVIGRTFRRAALEAVATSVSGERRAAGPVLEALAERGLLQPGEGDEYAFRTQALRDIAYQSMPSEARRSLHKAVAHWITEQRDLRQDGEAEVAGHLEAAGDMGAARAHYLAAARQAADVDANADAVVFYDKALSGASTGHDGHDEQAQQGTAGRAQARRELALVLARVGRFEDALLQLDHAASALRDDGVGAVLDAAGLELERAWVLKEQGRTEDALAAADRALAALPAMPATVLHLLVLAERAFLRSAKGEHRAARADCERGMALGDDVEDLGRDKTLALAKLQDTLAFTHVQEGALDDAEVAFRAALALRERASDRRGRLVALINLGGLAYSRGELSVAVERFRDALALAESVNRVKDVALCANNLGQAELATANLDVAIEHLEHARRLAEDNRLLDVLADSVRALADARLAAGDAAAALEEAVSAVVLAERAGVTRFKVAAHVSALRCLLARDDAPSSASVCEAAHDHLRAAVAMLRTSGSPADLKQVDELQQVFARRSGRAPDVGAA